MLLLHFWFITLIKRFWGHAPHTNCIFNCMTLQVLLWSANSPLWTPLYYSHEIESLTTTKKIMEYETLHCRVHKSGRGVLGVLCPLVFLFWLSVQEQLASILLSWSSLEKTTTLNSRLGTTNTWHYWLWPISRAGLGVLRSYMANV